MLSCNIFNNQAYAYTAKVFGDKLIKALRIAQNKVVVIVVLGAA
jgi:hypothetical protein